MNDVFFLFWTLNGSFCVILHHKFHKNVVIYRFCYAYKIQGDGS